MQNIKKIIQITKLRKWLWLGFATFMLGAFIVLSAEVREFNLGQPELIGEIDKVVLDLIVELRTPQLNQIAVDITALGSATVLTVIISIISFLFIFQKRFLMAGHLITVGLGSIVFTSFLKSYFERTRPEEIFRLVNVQGYSYPSGHSLSASAVYFTLAILACEAVKNKLGKSILVILFALLIVMIGSSRIYLGVHYFSDVTAGILLGAAWASLFGVVGIYTETIKNRL